MATWNVTTPVTGYTGTVAGVHFKDGTGQVDDAANPAAVEYFHRNGYGLTEAEPEPAPEPETATTKPAGKSR